MFSYTNTLDWWTTDQLREINNETDACVCARKREWSQNGSEDLSDLICPLGFVWWWRRATETLHITTGCTRSLCLTSATCSTRTWGSQTTSSKRTHTHTNTLTGSHAHTNTSTQTHTLTVLKHLSLFVFSLCRDIEILALFVSCMCHDLDHRGTNNSFQVDSVRSTISRLLSHLHFMCQINKDYRLTEMWFFYVCVFISNPSWRLFTVQKDL